MNYNILVEIENDFRLQREYEKTYFEEKIVKCKFLSKEFHYYLCLDKNMNRDILCFNHRNQYDYDYLTYIVAYPYVLEQNAVIRLLDKKYFGEHGFCIDTKEEHEFRFIIPKNEQIPTYDEFLNIRKQKKIDELISEEERVFKSKFAISNNDKKRHEAGEILKTIKSYKMK